MAYKRKHKLALAVITLLMVLAGCGPEGARQRGAGYGSGADVDNHPPAAEFEPCSKVFSESCNP